MLYLCRRGPTWVVVIESPRVTDALRLRHSGRDPYDARYELLCLARRACPDAAILSTDGALESADYEWRLEVRGAEAQAGDLGLAIQHALSGGAPPTHVRRRLQRFASLRSCHWGSSSSASGRPRSF
jgi:hypothetical protein